MFEDADANGTKSTSGDRSSPAAASSGPRKTEAERRFEEVQKRRVSLHL